MTDDCAPIAVAESGIESLTVAEAARFDGGRILPDETDESQPTLADWSAE